MFIEKDKKYSYETELVFETKKKSHTERRGLTVCTIWFDIYGYERTI